MMFRGKQLFNASFDVYADNYDSVRPSYPEALFSKIWEICEPTDDSTCLEIGSGSGIATAEIAKKYGKVVALEPGENLVNAAKKRLAGLDNIEFITDTFENYDSANKFHEIMAFTSFHWLSDEEKFVKIARLLDEHGKLVIVWNSFFQSESDAMRAVNKVYAERLPDVYGGNDDYDVNAGVLEKLSRRISMLASNPIFQTVYLEEFFTQYHYSAETYPRLLATFPKIIDIENDEKRSGFLDDISAVVEKYGEVVVPVLSSLIILEKKQDFIKGIVQERS